MLSRDEKMQPELVDFANFAQGFGFTSMEAISEAKEFPKTHQVGFHQGCDTGWENAYIHANSAHCRVFSQKNSFKHKDCFRPFVIMCAQHIEGLS